MPRARASLQRAPRALTPLAVAIGPLICAVTLTALAFFMFKAQVEATHQASFNLTPLEYTVILALAGALIALLMGALGLTLHNRARRAQEIRDEALAEGLARLARIEELAKRIGQRGEWREAAAMAWMRRQRRSLEAINAMAEPRAALQRAASDIWAGMSQPGAPLDARSALGLTRQSAISGAALGAALDELQAQLIGLPVELDEMKAAGDTLFQELNALEEATRHMRLMLNIAAGAESEALTGHMPAQRSSVATKSPFETRVLGAVSPGERGNLEPNALNGAVDSARVTPPQAPPAGWPSSATGIRGATHDQRQRPRWPGGADLPPLDPDTRDSRLRPPGGQSGKWPRQPGQPGRPGTPPSPSDGRPPAGPQPESESGSQWRDPRRRDDTNSHWLND